MVCAGAWTEVLFRWEKVLRYARAFRHDDDDYDDDGGGGGGGGGNDDDDNDGGGDDDGDVGTL